jgi:hypothetical protein
MAAPDKGLSGISIWLSLALLAGIVVLPFLPGDDAKQPAPGGQTAPIGSVSGATNSSDATASRGDGEDTATGEMVEEAWTQAELTGGLRECLRLLAPIAVDVNLAEPIKKGACGSPAPLEVRGLGGDKKVTFRPAPTMNCRLAAGLSDWVETVLQPAAREELGSPVTRIVGASSYSCRNIYNNPELSLSEHATGNAIDIVGFVTADGRTVKVLTHWGPTRRDIAKAKKVHEAAKAAAAKAAAAKKKKYKTGERATIHKARLKVENAPVAPKSGEKALLAPAKTKEAAFLKRLHKGACNIFETALGPELNEPHRNHFHFDMKQRRRRSVCR